MKAAEIKKQIVADLTPFYAEHGYHKKAEPGAVASYRQEIEGGYRVTGISSRTIHFATELWVGYGVRFHAVEALMEKLKQEVQWQGVLSATSTTVGSSWNLSVFSGISRTWIPEIYNEETYALARDALKNEFLTYGLPFMNWVQNVQQIDAIINGEPFWNDPRGYSPNSNNFSTGAEWKFSVSSGYFEIKRLAIAKVAGNPDFERVVRLNIESINERKSRYRDPQIVQADDMTHPVPRAAAFLRALGNDWRP